MIIGSGLMGRALRDLDRQDSIFFVSGVSNSKTKNKIYFERERKLLLKTIKTYNKKLIYLSTCDIYDTSKKSSPYLLHKLNMENLIKNNCKSWIIFRVSQVIGNGGNNNNLLFKLCYNIFNEKKFILYPYLERNLIYINELKKAISIYINQENKIINIANPINIKVLDLIQLIEAKLNKKAIYNICQEKNTFKIFLDKNFPFKIFKNKNYYKNRVSLFVRHFIESSTSNV